MINKDRDNYLDFTFKEMNELSYDISDAIFIFFNYLFCRR